MKFLLLSIVSAVLAITLASFFGPLWLPSFTVHAERIMPFPLAVGLFTPLLGTFLLNDEWVGVMAASIGAGIYIIAVLGSDLSVMSLTHALGAAALLIFLAVLSLALSVLVLFLAGMLEKTSPHSRIAA